MNVSSLSQLCFVASTSTNSYSMWNISFDMDKYLSPNMDITIWYVKEHPLTFSRGLLPLYILVFDGEHLIDTRRKISILYMTFSVMNCTSRKIHLTVDDKYHIVFDVHIAFDTRRGKVPYVYVILPCGISRKIHLTIRRGHGGINTKILLCLRFGIISFNICRVNNKYHKVTSRNICTTLRRGQVYTGVVSYTRLSVCRVRLHISLYI